MSREIEQLLNTIAFNLDGSEEGSEALGRLRYILKQPAPAGDIKCRVDTTEIGIYDISGKLKYRRPWCHPDTREAFNTLGYSIGSPDTQAPESQQDKDGWPIVSEHDFHTCDGQIPLEQESQQVECSLCDGEKGKRVTGIAYSQDEWEDCPQCHGTGREAT